MKRSIAFAALLVLTVAQLTTYSVDLTFSSSCEEGASTFLSYADQPNDSCLNFSFARNGTMQSGSISVSCTSTDVYWKVCSGSTCTAPSSSAVATCQTVQSSSTVCSVTQVLEDVAVSVSCTEAASASPAATLKPSVSPSPPSMLVPTISAYDGGSGCSGSAQMTQVMVQPCFEWDVAGGAAINATCGDANTVHMTYCAGRAALCGPDGTIIVTSPSGCITETVASGECVQGGSGMFPSVSFECGRQTVIPYPTTETVAHVTIVDSCDPTNFTVVWAGKSQPATAASVGMSTFVVHQGGVINGGSFGVLCPSEWNPMYILTSDSLSDYFRQGIALANCNSGNQYGCSLTAVTPGTCTAIQVGGFTTYMSADGCKAAGPPLVQFNMTLQSSCADNAEVYTTYSSSSEAPVCTPFAIAVNGHNYVGSFLGGCSNTVSPNVYEPQFMHEPSVMVCSDANCAQDCRVLSGAMNSVCSLPGFLPLPVSVSATCSPWQTG